MTRGLQGLFESGTPSLVLSLIVLVGAIAYGLYSNRDATASAADTAVAATAAAGEANAKP